MTTATTEQFLKECRDVYALLEQDQVWVDIKHNVHQIAEMSIRYKTNVVAFLERRAPGLCEKYAYGEIQRYWTNGPNGQMAQDALEEELDRADDERRADPVAWLRSTKLMQRLAADIATGIDGDDD